MTTSAAPLPTGVHEPSDDGSAREPLGPRFGAHLTATGLANLADGVVAVGLPLYAVTLTRSPVLISLLTAAGWLPWLLLAILGGLLVDRSDRKRVQVVGLTVRAAALAGAAVLIASGRMTIGGLIALALVYGATDVVVDLAEGAIIPDLVPRSRLQAANGRVMAAQQVSAAFLGAPVAGALLGLGATWVVGHGSRPRRRGGGRAPGGGARPLPARGRLRPRAASRCR